MAVLQIPCASVQPVPYPEGVGSGGVVRWVESQIAGHVEGGHCLDGGKPNSSQRALARVERVLGEFRDQDRRLGRARKRLAACWPARVIETGVPKGSADFTGESGSCS